MKAIGPIVVLLALVTPAPAATHIGVTFARTEIDVAAEITGVLEDVRVRMGDRVTAGTVLATFRSEPIRRALERARAALNAAGAEVELRALERQQAMERVERRQDLDGAVSEEQLAELESERDAALSRLRMAEALVVQRTLDVQGLEDDLYRTEVRAPFDGTISVVHQDAGALLSPGAAVVRLLSTDLWLRFAVPPEVARALRPDQVVRFRSDDGKVYAATVRQIAPDVDPIAGLVFVEADIDEAAESGLVAGIVSRVTVD